VLRGGLCDRRALSDGLLEELHRCGSLPGHGRAFRSLNQQWRSWINAREVYPRIDLPVTLVYGDHDWSHPDEREANARAIAGATTISLERCGHFASLDQPDKVARLITQEPSDL
jgi:pimeloyl-ACP methyl ester carboxylesterase